MFELGPEKIMVILAVVFIFGPKELPAAARKISAGMRKLRSLQDDLRAGLGTVLELPTVEESTFETTDHARDADHSGAAVEPPDPGFPPGPSSFL
jgi:Sec-independent protein translocase protein TatA